jgi:hypothetical protein
MVLKDLVDAMQDRLAALEARGAQNLMAPKVEAVERSIKYALIDFENERFRPSFANIRDAQKTLDEIALELMERDFDAQLNVFFGQFSDQLHKFGPVLDMGSPAMTELMIGYQGRARAVTVLRSTPPSELRNNLAEIGANIRAMEVPHTRIEVHKAALDVMEMAVAAAADFEKLAILDQYSPSQAREIVQGAYLQMYKARRRQQDLQNAILHPEVQNEPLGVERVTPIQGS